MNYSEMPAGAVMDHAAAVRCSVFESAIIRDGVCWIRRKDSDREERWQPSANIAHAWEVVEFLRRDFWITIKDMRVHYYVTIAVEISDIIPPAFATAPTAQLAICRAALLAAGVK
jgi:hypothetical protein